MSTKNRPRGRPSKVYDTDGKLVVGLSFWKKGRGIYHVTGRRDIQFGSELIPSMRAFRAWEAQQEGRRVTIIDPSVKITSESVSILRPQIKKYEIRSHTVHDLPRELVVEKLIEWLADPVECRALAQATGYPLDRLELLPPRQKTVLLSKALELYKGKLRKISDGELAEVQRAWNHFSKSVGCLSLEDVTKDALSNWIAGLFNRYSVKTARNRIARIKTVLRYNLKHENDLANCERLLRYFAAQELPSQEIQNPSPISRSDFQKLIEAAQQTKASNRKRPNEVRTRLIGGYYWDAILLTALNCAFYAIDVIRLPVSSIDLTKGTITFVRAKKNTPRVAVLWKRTVNALKPIIANRDHRTFVFETQRGGPGSSRAFAKAFARLRSQAGLPSSVEFSSIRDGALTAAIAANCHEKEAKILAGHRIQGETDAYVLRNPSMVKTACKAIERHYFPVVKKTPP